MLTTTTYQARMLENPNDPVNSAWVELVTGECDWEGITDDTLEGCKGKALDALLERRDITGNPNENDGFAADIARLFIAKIDTTYIKVNKPVYARP